MLYAVVLLSNLASTFLAMAVGKPHGLRNAPGAADAARACLNAQAGNRGGQGLGRGGAGLWMAVAAPDLPDASWMSGAALGAACALRGVTRSLARAASAAGLGAHRRLRTRRRQRLEGPPVAG